MTSKSLTRGSWITFIFRLFAFRVSLFPALLVRVGGAKVALQFIKACLEVCQTKEDLLLAFSSQAEQYASADSLTYPGRTQSSLMPCASPQLLTGSESTHLPILALLRLRKAQWHLTYDSYESVGWEAADVFMYSVSSAGVKMHFAPSFSYNIHGLRTPSAAGLLHPHPSLWAKQMLIYARCCLVSGRERWTLLPINQPLFSLSLSLTHSCGEGGEQIRESSKRWRPISGVRNNFIHKLAIWWLCSYQKLAHSKHFAHNRQRNYIMKE